MERRGVCVNPNKIHGTMSQNRRSLRRSLPSLQGLMVFEASARHLNFSKAAEELLISQSAVSHAVKQLEESLGHPLFLRENRMLRLTSQGQKLFASVAAGFGTIAETIEDIGVVEQKDKVVLSCSTIMATEWFLPRSDRLRKEMPDTRVDVLCFDRDPDLARLGIDVQIRLGEGNWPEYDAIRLRSEEIFPVCSPAYLQAHPIAGISDLPGHELIAYVDPLRERTGWAEWLRAKDLAVEGRLKPKTQVNDSLVALKSAEAGAGLALGWSMTADRALEEGRVVRALADTLETGRAFYALTPKATPLRRSVRNFVDWLAREAAQ